MDATIDYWPGYPRPIFDVIGAAMASKRLHPDVRKRAEVSTVFPAYGDWGQMMDARGDAGDATLCRCVR